MVSAQDRAEPFGVRAVLSKAYRQLWKRIVRQSFSRAKFISGRILKLHRQFTVVDPGSRQY